MLRERYNGVDYSGEIIKSGKVIGKHNGVYNFTIGQRKRALGNYVVGLNGNDVVVSDNPVAVNEIKVGSINWTGYFCEDVMVQTRYRQKAVRAKISVDGRVRFAEPQYSIGWGEVAVFSDGD